MVGILAIARLLHDIWGTVPASRRSYRGYVFLGRYIPTVRLVATPVKTLTIGVIDFPQATFVLSRSGSIWFLL
jgi:hypothetical protein